MVADLDVQRVHRLPDGQHCDVETDLNAYDAQQLVILDHLNTDTKRTIRVKVKQTHKICASTILYGRAFVNAFVCMRVCMYYQDEMLC